MRRLARAENPNRHRDRGYRPAGPSRGRRRATRRAQHVVAMTLGLLLAALAIRQWQPGLPGRAQWSLACAYAGFALLLMTLLLGPLKVARHRPNPVSTDLRRDVGIGAALASAVHVVLSLGDHLGGNVVRYFFEPAQVAAGNLRHDSFGIGAWIGAVALTPLAALAVTSNDRSVRRLGRRRWKALHRLAYPLVVLVLIHTVAFLHATNRRLLFVAAVAGSSVITTAAQLFGVALYRRRVTSRGRA